MEHLNNPFKQKWFKITATVILAVLIILFVVAIVT